MNELDGIVLFFNPASTRRKAFINKGRDADFGLARPEDYDERAWPL